MQITNNEQWLWRVTQAISFFVQQSVFSWALPAGVRIPSNASFLLPFFASFPKHSCCCKIGVFLVRRDPSNHLDHGP